MSLSKRMIAARQTDAPHPLACWRSEAEHRASQPGRWLNPIGLDLETLKDPGWTIEPSKAPGFVSVGPNRFSQATWTPTTQAPEPEPEPKPKASAKAGRPQQMTFF